MKTKKSKLSFGFGHNLAFSKGFKGFDGRVYAKSSDAEKDQTKYFKKLDNYQNK